jgi:conjugal transfer pilus assembly protein TraL
MSAVTVPQTIDDPVHLLLWSADEIIPFLVCMLTGMLADHFLMASLAGLFSVKAYRRFRDNRPDGYTLHAVYWLGLLPSASGTIPNPFIRRFLP